MARVDAIDGNRHLFENSTRIIECLEKLHREYRTTRRATGRGAARRGRRLLWPGLAPTTAPRGNP
jgi:hypothetical protein